MGVRRVVVVLLIPFVLYSRALGTARRRSVFVRKRWRGHAGSRNLWKGGDRSRRSGKTTRIFLRRSWKRGRSEEGSLWLLKETLDLLLLILQLLLLVGLSLVTEQRMNIGHPGVL